MSLDGRFCLSPALPEFPRGDPMTAEAKCADIVEVAFPPALTHRQNMVSIPKAFTRAAAKPPVLQQLLPAISARVPESPLGNGCIDGALRTNTFVSQEDLLTQVAGLRSQLPFMHAEL